MKPQALTAESPIRALTADKLLARMQEWKQADDAWILAKAEVCLLLARDRLGQVPDQELEEQAFELMKLSSEQITREVKVMMKNLRGKTANLPMLFLDMS